MNCPRCGLPTTKVSELATVDLSDVADLKPEVVTVTKLLCQSCGIVGIVFCDPIDTWPGHAEHRAERRADGAVALQSALPLGHSDGCPDPYVG